jgi:hypothetical protein
MRNLAVFLLAIALLPASAQVSAPPPRNTTRPPAPASLQPSPLLDVTANIAQLNQLVENTRVDLARLRVEKWKTDSGSKRQAESNAESVQRNMTSALPGIVQQVRANPGSVAAAFKLYRNLNALYDVMSSLTEWAGAFGSKEEYQALASDTASLDKLRRSLADQVEAMAASRDTEVAQLQTRVRQVGATSAAPPKKIVVDENEPAKKPAKKSTPKKKTPTTAGAQQPAAPKSQ